MTTGRAAQPVVLEIEFTYEPDDGALEEAIAILLGDDAAAESGEAA